MLPEIIIILKENSLINNKFLITFNFILKSSFFIKSLYIKVQLKAKVLKCSICINNIFELNIKLIFVIIL